MACRSHFLTAFCVVSVWASIAGHASDRSYHASQATVLTPVHAAFSLEAPNRGPFPSDWFTVEDPNQLTGLRVNLPMPDCGTPPISDCLDFEQINTLDGFNVEPRLSIPFDGPIDVDSVTSEAIFLLRLRSPRDEHMVGLNQVVWDPKTFTLHVESDELLDQHTRYALIVTSRVLDSSGNPIGATEAFRRFRQTVPHPYKKALLDAVHSARRVGIREHEIAVASVFTTQSTTAILEKMRDQIRATIPEPADFLLANGTRTVFLFDDVQDIQWRRHTGLMPDTFSTQTVNLITLSVFPGALSQVAYGRYRSPQYREEFALSIPPVATRTGNPEVQAIEDVYFNLYLPPGTPPPSGWPVQIMGLGGGSPKENLLPQAAVAAANGVASIVINPCGHGFGPLSTLTVRFKTGGSSPPFTAGGRGRDVNGNRVIGSFEGFSARRPQIYNRDGVRQTAADLMQLVRVIERGIDVDGDGVFDLDSSRIYFYGISNGGMIGTVFMAVDPVVRVGFIDVAGGSLLEVVRTSPVQRTAGAIITGRTPSLINPPGITHLDEVPLSPIFFNENLPLRDGVPYEVRLQDGTTHVIRSPVIDTVNGANAIQEVLERFQWIQQAGEPAAYGPHLRKAPLQGVPTKSMLIRIAKGDQNVPNPSNTTIIRASGLADRTTYYRNDIAFAEDKTVPKNPHGFLGGIFSTNPLRVAISAGALNQIGVFMASDGVAVIHPEPVRFFETPISLPLPEGLNFIP